MCIKKKNNAKFLLQKNQICHIIRGCKCYNISDNNSFKYYLKK